MMDTEKTTIVVDVPANARCLRFRQAASYCGVSLNTFREMYDQGFVPRRKVEGTTRIAFDIRHLDALIDSWPVQFAKKRVEQDEVFGVVGGDRGA